MRALFVTLFSGILTLNTLSVFASSESRKYQMEHKFEKAQTYFLDFKEDANNDDFEALRPWLKTFTDIEVMAEVMSDPRKMVGWMNAISNPESVYLMMQCSQEPVMWDTWLIGLTDAGKMGRALSYFVDPETYMNWMVAWFDPNLYLQSAKMVEPQKLLNWAEQGLNVKLYEPMFSWLNPEWYEPRLNWVTDLETFQPLMDIFGVRQSL